jgi:hypothetical protein
MSITTADLVTCNGERRRKCLLCEHARIHVYGLSCAPAGNPKYCHCVPLVFPSELFRCERDLKPGEH